MSHEFAFDVKLQAVVRVRAETLEQARAKLEMIDCWAATVVSGDPPPDAAVRITEFSLAEEVSRVFEIDGEDV